LGCLVRVACAAFVSGDLWTINAARYALKKIRLRQIWRAERTALFPDRGEGFAF